MAVLELKNSSNYWNWELWNNTRSILGGRAICSWCFWLLGSRCGGSFDSRISDTGYTFGNSPDFWNCSLEKSAIFGCAICRRSIGHFSIYFRGFLGNMGLTGFWDQLLSPQMHSSTSLCLKVKESPMWKCNWYLENL